MPDAPDDALTAWLALPEETPLAEAAQALMPLPLGVRARAALVALREVLAVSDPDPTWGRPRAVAEALAAWLADPGEATLRRVTSATGAAESAWNAVAGDRGQPEPTWQAATYAGWVVTEPDRAWGVVHTLTGAGKGVGEATLLAAVRAALAAELTLVTPIGGLDG